MLISGVFKLPLNLASEVTPACNMAKHSDRGVLLQQCKLIVWDKCTMSHKHVLEALNHTLQDFRGNQAPLMGGVVVLFAGSLRQTLPVIESGTQADEIKRFSRHRHCSRTKNSILHATCTYNYITTKIQVFLQVSCYKSERVVWNLTQMEKFY